MGSLWELLAGSFLAWFLMGCQALFDMGPVEKGLFCLVARSVPMGVQSVRDTSPCVGGCPLGIEGLLLPPSSQL